MSQSQPTISERRKGLSSLYHATYPELIRSIVNSGLRPGIDGEVYMCESMQSAFRFVSNIPWSDDLKPTIYVVEVGAFKLDRRRLRLGTDHDWSVLGNDTWTYTTGIPPTAFLRVHKLELISLDTLETANTSLSVPDFIDFAASDPEILLGEEIVTNAIKTHGGYHPGSYRIMQRIKEAERAYLEALARSGGSDHESGA